MKLKYNFTALRFMEQAGVILSELGDGISMEKILIMVAAGLNVGIDEAEGILNNILDEKGMEAGLSYVAEAIAEALEVTTTKK
jgi:hypothetical protein